MDTKELQDKLFRALEGKEDYTIEDFYKELENKNIKNDSYKINLKFVNKSNNPNPEYSSEFASGFDIRAYIPDGKPITLKARGKAIIETGLSFDIPNNMEIQIRSRSGLAYKNGVICHWGTVDSDYLGEVKLILFNLGEEDFIINNGDRMAQGVLAGCMNKQLVDLECVKEIIKETERAGNGFGSTGIQ